MVEYMMSMEDGRFKHILEATHLRDVCMKCGYWNPNVTELYRCASVPGCPGVTLSGKVKNYIWRKHDRGSM